MKRPAPGGAEWVVGALVGILLGSVVAWATQNWQEGRQASDVVRRVEVYGRTNVVPEPVDAVRALLGQDTLLAVDPLLADRVPEADRQRAEEILNDSPVPVRIAYLSYPTSNDVGYTPTGAAAMWRTAVGEEGHYVVLWDNGSYDYGSIGLKDEFVDTRAQGQPGPTLVRLAEEMATFGAESLPSGPAEPSDFDYWGGAWGGIAAAGLMGAFGVVPVFLLLRWYVGSRRRKVS